MDYHRAYLEAVLDRLDGPDGKSIRARAALVTMKWDNVPGTDPYFGRRWRQLLSMPANAVRAVVMADTHEGERLRHTMPFPNVLTNAERAELRRRTQLLRSA